MSYKIVPSKITLLEEKYSSGTRKLSIWEKTGLALSPPILRLNAYSKHSTTDLQNILERKYELENIMKQAPNTKTALHIADILLNRQESVKSTVLRRNFMWGGALLGSAATIFSARHYDYKSKCILAPFAFYGFSFIGRWVGDLILGRWSQYSRQRALGLLPAKILVND